MVTLIRAKDPEGNKAEILCPSSFSLKIWLNTSSITDTIDFILPILQENFDFTIQKTQPPLYTQNKKYMEKKLDEAIVFNVQQIDGEISLNDSITAYFSHLRKEESSPSPWLFHDLNYGSNIEIVHFVHESHTQLEIFQKFLKQATQIISQVLQSAKVYRVNLKRTGMRCFAPVCPLVSDDIHIVLTTHAEVEQNYENPEVFWQAGWSSVDEFGDQILLARGLDLVGEIEFKRQIYPHQWDLARAAKPGLCKYYTPNPRPEELFLLREAPEILNQVGYSDEHQFIEYACVPSEHHISPYEIYLLRQLVKKGQLEDGSPLKQVRVSFPNRTWAEQEKRPLLDNGIDVLYLDKMGNDCYLKD
jgi:hypothetical protein